MFFNPAWDPFIGGYPVGGHLALTAVSVSKSHRTLEGGGKLSDSYPALEKLELPINLELTAMCLLHKRSSPDEICIRATGKLFSWRIPVRLLKPQEAIDERHKA